MSDTELKSRILQETDAAYAKLEQLHGMVPRAPQKRLSAETALCLLTGSPVAVEAGTGTGKSIGYLIGIGVAQKMGITHPVVVATATKALQSQLLDQDVPRVVELGLLDAEKVRLLKSRSNYFCRESAANAQALLDSADPEVLVDEELLTLTSDEVQSLVEQWDSGQWDGDFDTLTQRKPRNVIPIAASSDTCVGPRCEYYKRCPAIKSRSDLEKLQVVVTNQDLLLADLQLRASAMGVQLLPADKFGLVVDEAHHLAEKAANAGTAALSPKSIYLALALATPIDRLAREDLHLVGLGLVTPSLKPLRSELGQFEDDLRALEPEAGPLLRFPRAELPETLSTRLLGLGTLFRPLLAFARGALKSIASAEPATGGAAGRRLELVRRLRSVQTAAEVVVKTSDALEQALAGAEYAAWAEFKEDQLEFSIAPLEGAATLKSVVWDAEDIVKGVAMVSATLRDTTGFKRFRHRVGAPASLRAVALPPVLDYSRGVLCVPSMKFTPKFSNRDSFLKELEEVLPQHINPQEGTLVLFSSWAVLKQFEPVLRKHLGDGLFVQGSLAPKALVQGHRARIDQGEGSTLAGVATLSEGLDLAGAYCSHVCVVALPFSAPHSPVEAELAERLGSRYFSERSLPDAALRMTQMAGRLLRRESDFGRITVFDRRLTDTNYGQEILKAMPGFTLEVAPKISA